ncbi:hypothetical protein EDD52_101292 [Primorskyibacter sedentarius]|uniref:Tyr recombinase domain-containing protein n=2 Tax=Primorskyibacter sedentarius TaxID=745311 RepID=A0A4R3JLH4_9RHOB|nr:hypothetical protein EDD52_101292 [Primorskyibacter sedentarius]
METLKVSGSEPLDKFFAPSNWGDTRAKLRFKAQDKWANKSTLRAHLSRITKINELATELLDQGFMSDDGADWEYLTALEKIRQKIADRKIKSWSELERKANGQKSSYVGHLFSKKRKYLPNYSKRIEQRLEQLCVFLELDWGIMRPMLIKDGARRPVSKKLKPSGFSYYLKFENWPPTLQQSVNDIERFHMRMTPGQLPDGTPKLRNKKSQWKIRESDGKCSSKGSFHNLLGSFFGFCVLPSDKKVSEKLVLARLKTTLVKWQEEDFDQYVSWMTGEGRNAAELSISLLFDFDLIERWLQWLANRNGGIAETQPGYCLSLSGLTNPKTGAISQSYEIACQVMGFPPLSGPILRTEENELFQKRIREWSDFCGRASAEFRSLQHSFSSSKVKKKKRVSSRHSKILEIKDPLVPVQTMIERLHRSEPRHLDKNSQSWMVWARNMTLLELTVSNPIRADNLHCLNFCEDGSGRLRKTGDVFQIYLEKHEVKNPHKEKDYGYLGIVSPSASSWLNFYIQSVRPHWPTGISMDERLFLTDSGNKLSNIDLWKIFVTVSRLYLPEYSELNPHVYRHIVATSWLKNHPDDFVTVSLILGDRIETVMKDYAHLASSDGFSRYHKLLENWRGRTPPTMGGK